mgnify:CR=1 FL=1
MEMMLYLLISMIDIGNKIATNLDVDWQGNQVKYDNS